MRLLAEADARPPPARLAAARHAASARAYLAGAKLPRRPRDLPCENVNLVRLVAARSELASDRERHDRLATGVTLDSRRALLAAATERDRSGYLTS